MMFRTTLELFVLALASTSSVVRSELFCGETTDTTVTQLDFRNAGVRKGNDQNEELVRYQNIANLDGQEVDLVVKSLLQGTRQTDFTIHQEQRGWTEEFRSESKRLGRINLDPSETNERHGRGRFEFCFVKAGTSRKAEGNLVAVPLFDWYVLKNSPDLANGLPSI